MVHMSTTNLDERSRFIAEYAAAIGNFFHIVPIGKMVKSLCHDHCMFMLHSPMQVIE